MQMTGIMILNIVAQQVDVCSVDTLIIPRWISLIGLRILTKLSGMHCLTRECLRVVCMKEIRGEKK